MMMRHCSSQHQDGIKVTESVAAAPACVYIYISFVNGHLT